MQVSNTTLLVTVRGFYSHIIWRKSVVVDMVEHVWTNLCSLYAEPSSAGSTNLEQTGSVLTRSTAEVTGPKETMEDFRN